MEDLQIIEELISQENFDEALERLNHLIGQTPDSANLRYLRGKLLWKIDERGKSISDFEHAVALDPESPAKNALAIAYEIMGFYNPDLLNP